MLEHNQSILVTGATGYIGGRLTPQLLSLGYEVRVFVRDANRLKGRSWVNDVQIVEGDVMQPDTLKAAMKNVKSAYYLIHSMTSVDNFHGRDIQAAEFAGYSVDSNKPRKQLEMV